MASSAQTPIPRTAQADTFWTRLSPTIRHAGCLGILLVVALAFYAPAVFEGKNIQGTDSITFRANAQVTVEHHQKTGEWARWAPNVFSGTPYINEQISVLQLDDVVNLVRGAVWPVSFLFLLMAGVYLLVFYLTRNHLSGLLSGLAFGFTTYIPIIIGVGHGTKFVALAYAPYVVLAFVYTLRNPSLLGGGLFAGALALQLRANHPQIVFYTGMLLLLWWIVEAIGAWRENRVPELATSTGWLALGTVLSLAMAAEPYLARYQYKQYSVRGAAAAVNGGEAGGGGMGWTAAMRWSHGPKELFTFVVADAFGGGGQTYWGPKTFTEGPHYVGGVVMALAGLAVWRVRTWLVWGLGFGVLGTALFALGKYAAWLNWPMFQYFPFFDAFRAPEMWLSVTALTLVVLAGIGLDYALRREERQGRRMQSSDPRQRPLLIAFGAVFGTVALVWLAPNTFFDFEKPNEQQRIRQALLRQNPNVSPQNPRVQKAVQQQMQKLKTQRRDAFTTDTQRTMLFLVLAAGVLVLYRRETLPAWGAGLVIVAIVGIDLWGVDARYMGDERYSSQDVRQSIPTYQFDQFIKKKQQQAGGLGHFRVLSLVEGDPTSKARPSYHYENVGGYHGAKLQRYQHYLDHILQVNGSGPPNENALDLMNTRYIVARQQMPGTEVAYRSPKSGVLVLENNDALPRGFLVGQTEVVDAPKQTWSRLRSPSFNPRQTALLPAPLDQPVRPIDSNSTAEVVVENYEPEEIRWTVETNAPRFFVASEVYYPAGWNAYLDGEQVPIQRTNYLLRGVHVPEGEHTLEMRFEPKADRYGTRIAWASTIFVYGGVFALVGLRVRRQRRADADDEEA
ncbi:YfhO family protein [Salinibacter grassmerensis]|uniref:YfhO family protein n=1 Tax=Salinibacter grassmerensis TaxID=3040353 RepID=UPI0021E75529|nr:YfhO family protein [Salinibacter grassmerensis]